jgi:hypothetical protein
VTGFTGEGSRSLYFLLHLPLPLDFAGYLDKVDSSLPLNALSSTGFVSMRYVQRFEIC